MDGDDQISRGIPSNVNEESISQSQSKKPKILTSDVWNHFVKIGVGSDGKPRCKCKGCGKEYSCPSKSGTSHLSRHIPKCMMISKYNDAGDMLIDYEGKLKRKKIDPKVNRELIAQMIISHGAPFNMVEWKGFRNYQKFLNEHYKFICRNIAKADVLRTYEIEKEKLKQQLAQIPGRVCLTSDVWTACTNHGFISLTVHYVDGNWKLNSKILSFAHMKPPHSGHELSLKVLEFLKDWGLEKKKISLTLDNATSNDNMQNILKEHLNLSNTLLLNGEFFHIRCCAHILNLIVQDGLKVASEALHKIRQSVHYVRGSEARMRQFYQCIKQVGGIDTGIGLRPDVVTRWNSTYIMLESALKYRRAFYSLSLCDKNYRWCPSSDEWTRGEIICEFLKPFYTITNLISGSSYPTSNLYFGEIWRIECLLTSNLENDDELIASMSARMKEKFDKYWSDYRVVLAFGAILDPTKKFNFLRYTYSKLNPYNYEEKLERVKTALYRLYGEYVNNGLSSSSSMPSSNVSGSQISIGGEQAKKSKNIYDDFEAFDCQVSNDAGKSQHDLYLEEPRIPISGAFDVLAYWRERANRGKIIAKMACDILSILITTVASESAFSIGSRILNKYRSRLHDETVQALLCTRSWLHGFGDDDEEESSSIDDIRLSKQDSNVVVDEEDED